MPLHLRTYRYGESGGLTGLSIGVARHLPRGVRHEDYRRKGYFDVWLPLLAPEKELVADYKAEKIPFETFAKRYRSQMGKPEVRHVIQLVAAMALKHPVNLGCYCEDESRCHRSLLQALVAEAVEDLPPPESSASRGSSPPCSMPEIAD